VTVDIVCSRSGAAMFVSPVDASKDGIRAIKIYMAKENEAKNLDSDIMLEDSPLASPIIKHM
jgi:hypothetical protein